MLEFYNYLIYSIYSIYKIHKIHKIYQICLTALCVFSINFCFANPLISTSTSTSTPTPISISKNTSLKNPQNLQDRQDRQDLKNLGDLEESKDLKNLKDLKDLELPKTKTFYYQNNKNSKNNTPEKKFNLAIAVSDAARAKGLMEQKIKANQGMLFVFTDKENRKPCFWMKNTVQDLSIFFLDEIGKIQQKELMKAATTNLHCAKQPSKYAIELSPEQFDLELNASFKICKNSNCAIDKNMLK